MLTHLSVSNKPNEYNILYNNIPRSRSKKHDPLTWRMVDGKATPPLSSTAGPRPLIRTSSEGSMLEGPSTYDEARDIKLFLDTTNYPSLGVRWVIHPQLGVRDAD